MRFLLAFTFYVFFSKSIYNCTCAKGHLIFGTNRTGVCNFLLVISSNLDPILPRFRDIARFMLKTAIRISISLEFCGLPFD